MEKVSGYSVITRLSAQELVNAMRDYLAQGWSPVGGVAVVRDGPRLVFAQAIVK